MGPYTIGEPVGAGARGEVYRAEDSRDGSVVAVKVLPEQYAHDPTARGRFRREVTALTALSHPNILRIFDFETDGGVPYAAMELLEGESLRQRLARGPLPWREAVPLATALADGLAAIHAAGILHRDLKPDNIFLTASGAKILDFGLARLEMVVSNPEDAMVKTGANVMLGTVPYMPPEQLCGLTLDARSDIFSFGCVLYDLIAATVIFARRNRVEAMSAILESPAPALAHLGVEAPAALEAVMRRCVEKVPADRFQAATEIVAALRAL